MGEVKIGQFPIVSTVRALWGYPYAVLEGRISDFERREESRRVWTESRTGGVGLGGGEVRRVWRRDISSGHLLGMRGAL
jgi:hypothetical protein